MIPQQIGASMKSKFQKIFATVITLAVVGCATPEVPKEMVLKDSRDRRFESNVGSSVESIRLACAKNMLAASPADRATDIETRVLATGDITTVEVDAVIYLTGAITVPLAVTFNCSYKGGNSYQTHWTRGL